MNERGTEPSHPSRGEPTDHELLAAVGSGSEASFELLFNRWAPRIRSFLIRATGSREVGEDLMQDTFLRILRAAPRYAPTGPAAAWIYRISANLAYSFWRRGRHVPEPLAGVRDAGRDGGSRGGDDPESERLRSAFVHQLDHALRRLPANQRMTFMLKVDQGLTYEQIAEVLCCPVGTVKSRFHHAALKLRADLREWEGGLRAEYPGRRAGSAGIVCRTPD